MLARHAPPLSDFTFASLLVWSTVYEHRWAFAGPETLLVSTRSRELDQPALLQPIGSFPRELQEAILDRARALPAPLRIESVSSEFLERHAEFAAHFDVAPLRDCANYVYRAQDLAELRGRHYAGKRNLVKQAWRTGNLRIEPLTAARARECLDVVEDIARKRSTDACLTLEQETQALVAALRLLCPLGLQGVLASVDGQPAAFSIFDRLRADTAVVLFERARRTEKGLYQAINQETARMIAAQGFSSINREEDLGDAGLRRAKLSYHPVRLEMKHTLTLRSTRCRW